MPGGRLRETSPNRPQQHAGWRIELAIGDAARRQAAQLALCQLPPEARRAQFDKVTADREDRHLLLWARREGEVGGALLINIQPGRVAVFWPPQLRAGAPDELREALLRRGAALLAPRDVRLAQAVLLPDDAEQRRAFGAAGFLHATDLAILRASAAVFPEAPPAADWETEAYTQENHARFAKTIQATYQDTLDCPQLNGVRDVEDVLASYRATGRFEPARWLLVRGKAAEVAGDAGCLLLTALEDGNWELLYVGLRPKLRGRGWGTELVRYAQWLARRGGASGLELAVDVHNTPALAAYAGAGMHAVGQRGLWVCYGDCPDAGRDGEPCI